MIEQVDWNFGCKVADTMESDRQEGITALSNGAILLGGMLNYVELATNRQAGKREVGADSGLIFGIVLGRYYGLGIRLNFGLRIVVFHTILQRANALAQTLAQLRQFLGAEYEQCNGEDHQ
jgi:hypothetical protein